MHRIVAIGPQLKRIPIEAKVAIADPALRYARASPSPTGNSGSIRGQPSESPHFEEEDCECKK
jgi:hypothetical protein